MPDANIINLTDDRWSGDLPVPSSDQRRVLIYAAGGLENEAEAVAHARRHVEWCRNQGVYPLYVLWRTDLLNSLRTLVEDARRRPNVYPWDGALDPLTERVVRRCKAPAWWAEVKQSAEASAARAVAGLHSIWRRPDLEVFAAGHGAGAILMAHLVRGALDSGLGSFRNLFLLAPALRVDRFDRMLAPLLGNGVGRLTVFAQRPETEQKDRLSRYYTKSMLYLVSHALEPEYNVPLLGLEDCLRGSIYLAARMGLAGVQAPYTRVEWVDASHAGLAANPVVLDSMREQILTDAWAGASAAEQPVRQPDERQDGYAHDDRQPDEQRAEEQPIAA